MYHYFINKGPNYVLGAGTKESSCDSNVSDSPLWRGQLRLTEVSAEHGQREESLPQLEKVFLSFSRHHLPRSFHVTDPAVSAEVHKPVQTPSSQSDYLSPVVCDFLWRIHPSVPLQERETQFCKLWSISGYWKERVRSNVFTNSHSTPNYTGCCNEIILLPGLSSYECSLIF